MVLPHLPPNAKALALKPEGLLTSCSQSVPAADWTRALDTLCLEVVLRVQETPERVSWKQHTLSALLKLVFLARNKQKGS